MWYTITIQGSLSVCTELTEDENLNQYEEMISNINGIWECKCKTKYYS